jgi:hypothetical protein
MADGAHLGRRLKRCRHDGSDAEREHDAEENPKGAAGTHEYDAKAADHAWQAGGVEAG